MTGEHLEGAALGVAKLVVARGTDVLSPKQRHVFETYVLSEDNVLKECARCPVAIGKEPFFTPRESGQGGFA